MNFFLRFIAVFLLSIKRMYNQRGLVLANALGVVAAVALTMSVPMYADAVYQNILEQEIRPEAGSSDAVTRPSFAFLYRYVGSWAGAIDWEQLAPADLYLSQQVDNDLGLNPRMFVRYLKTSQLMLFPAGEGSYRETILPLDFLYLATLSQQDEYITLTDGVYPQPAGPDGVVEVLMREDRANELGIQAGEEYTLLAILETGSTKTRVEIPARISGVWKATDPTDPYWFYSQTEFAQVLLAPEATLIGRIFPAIENKVDLVVWYWVMDPSTVQSRDVPGLLRRIDVTRRRATNYVPKLRLDLSPEESLAAYRRSATSLTIFLYAFSIPLLAMILVFVSLVMNMVVGHRRNEIAVLRSRGSTTAQLVAMAVLESTLLVLVGLALGAPLARGIAVLLGRARSFLDFSTPVSLHPQISLQALQFGLVAGVIAVLAQTLPTFSAAKDTIVSYKRDRARSLRKAWWKRAWLDVGLLVPALYGIYLLRQRAGMGVGTEPFENPLLLLIPALAIFSLILMVLRVLPLLMELTARITARTGSVGVMMAARHLARTGEGYSAPLILLGMTLSLSTFIATMAQTLDHHTYDHTYYRVGADIRVMLNLTENFVPGQAQASDEEEGAQQWYFLPITEHLTIPGTRGAARVARSTMRLDLGGQSTELRYLGLDWADFPRVSFWRGDFAPVSLGELMNRLAAEPAGLLVSRDLLKSQNLTIGEGLVLNAYAVGERLMIPYRIVGVIDYFPTWYPADGPLVVGNLEYLFTQVGSEIPYDVWLDVEPRADTASIVDGVDALYRTVLNTEVAPAIISAEQSRPERQGFFGLLSVGFTALAFLSVIGFLLYALFSFRRRFVELGMLRAIGLSPGQMLILLASELAFLFLAGLAAGTGLGVWISSLFIPYMQVGNDFTARIPPFLVQINWLAVYQIYALFGLLFVVALAILGVLLMRMKIFQAIKFGEVV
jgi:putative ABC transport system permease protein